MRKIYSILIAALLSAAYSNANTVQVDVINNQFSPSTVNVVVGDIVQFNFNVGIHNVTSEGGSVPLGAGAMFSGDPTTGARTYSYTVSIQGTYNYNCAVHKDFGMTGTIIASGLLPVKLISFNVTQSSNQNPLISWKTVAEENIDYYSVRRSTDGNHFKEIGKIEAGEQDGLEQSYSFSDYTLGNGYRFAYYEIVIVDKNQQLTYSPIKMLRTTLRVSKLIMTLSPNPLKKPEQLQIQFNADKPGSMPIQVYDMAGKRVLTTNISAVPGVNSGHLHMCDLPAGIYNVVFNYDGLREARKIVIAQ